jgi:urease accessory protein
MHLTFIRHSLLAVLGTATSSLALAHVGADGAVHAHEGRALQSLVAGALHPLTGLDHLAAMLSVGAWSALSLPADAGAKPGALKLLAMPLAFAATLLLGALLGLAGLRLPGVEPMIAASLLVLGLLVATRMKMGTGMGAALMAVFALFHGIAHGAELGGHAAAALAGMVGSTALLHGLGLMMGLSLRDASHRPRRWAARLAGGAVALLGLGMLTPAMAALL